MSAFTDCPSLSLNKRYKEGTYRKLKKQTDFEVEKCPITCEQFTNKSRVILLECGHIFMESAFREWEKMSKFCPYCRMNFCKKLIIFTDYNLMVINGIHSK